ncbi:hypothetical protein GCK72_018921 [Caenorhabditis remanei]|uniref:Serpentine receptor class gamma n=1 Tax=Caenorhabditis remanei TaxID=31234 RepID=A0A6A5GB15_CAERE|nr:hypothetical protein GCK72_018921 [Caenorhabditis remanei]KAF1752367.1 hypothetical protein GCK72_018921 [Caenorhabditis remanei]
MEVLCLIYGIPSLILTTFFVPFLNRNEFKYSFYKILPCNLVLNIFCYLNGWFIRFCSWSFSVPMMLVVYENCIIAFHFTSCSVNFYYNAQAIGVILLTIHRLTSSKYITANQFWNKFYHSVYVLVITLSLGLALFVYLNGYILPKHFDYTTEMFLATPVDPIKYAMLSKIFFIESTIYFSSILILNISTIIAIRQRFIINSTSKKTQKLMRNLTTTALINSSLFFIVFVWQLLGANVFGVQFFMGSMYILSDALSLSLPYILLSFDQNGRSTLAKIIGGQAAILAKNIGGKPQRTTSVVSII